MREQRVVSLPATGVVGVIYVVEPGSISYIWDGSTFMIHEQRGAQFIDYPKRFRDVPGARKTKVLTA